MLLELVSEGGNEAVLEAVDNTSVRRWLSLTVCLRTLTATLIR